MFVLPNMESDEKYQDLIKSYQILLENEKRRLSSVNFKNNEEQIQLIEEKIEAKSLETIESDDSQGESDEFDKDNDSSQISNIVFKKQGIVHENPQDQDALKVTKHETHKRVRSYCYLVSSIFL